MIRTGRAILWLAFGVSTVMLWDQWQVHKGTHTTIFPWSSSVTMTAPAAVSPSDTVPAPASAPSGGRSEVPTPVVTEPAGQAVGRLKNAPGNGASSPEVVTVTTDVMRVTFDGQGASVIRTEFLEHASDPATETTGLPFVLLTQESNRTYVAQSGLVGGDFPNHKTPMTVSPGERALRDGANEIAVRFESQVQGGVKLVKTYTLSRGSYSVPVRYEVVNTGSVPVTPQLYLQLVRDGNPVQGESIFYSTFTGPAIYTEEQGFRKIEFDEAEDQSASIQQSSTQGYVAMVQHYFASAWILPTGAERTPFVRKLGDNLYSVGMIMPPATIASGATHAVEATFFAGPQAEKVLEQTHPKLGLIKDYGVLTVIAKPLYWLLDKLHAVIGNWGFAIMGLVLLIKIAFYWLQARAYESMARMKAVSPRVMQMRERYKDDPQRMQQEMMRIYREEKVNPLGGCLPVLVQIPVFIALYWVLLSSVEMRGAPWVGWIRDLSSPDPYFILPAVMTLTTLLQTALNPVPPDPMQARLMWIVPLVFSVTFFVFPAGLVLYWITNNVLSIAQQWMINKRMGVPAEFHLPRI